jgi:hypothetical protein
MIINTTAPSSSTDDPIDSILRELDLQIEADRKRRIADLLKAVKEACHSFALGYPGDPWPFGNLWWEVHQLFTRRMSALIDVGTQERHISPLVCEIAGLIVMAGLPLPSEIESLLQAAVEEVENELRSRQA